MGWEGRWTVSAVVPGGGVYDGTIDVAPLGPGYSFIWEITAGHYVGVALERRDGLFVACGEDFGGLELILIDVAEGKLERLDGDGNLRRASVRGGSDPDSAEWFVDDPHLHQIRVVPFGEALHAVLATSAGEEDCLAWWRGNSVGIARGPRFDQLVILFYPPSGERNRDGFWALGSHPDLGWERLERTEPS